MTRLVRSRSWVATGVAGALFVTVGSASADDAAPVRPHFGAGTALGDASDPSFAIRSADLDGDGHLDVIVGRGGHWPGQNAVYRGDGEGGFDAGAPFGPREAGVFDLVAGDIDADGATDIITGNSVSSRIAAYRGDARGNLGPAHRVGPRFAETRAVLLGDLDDDGDLDLVFVQKGSSRYPDVSPQNRVAMNNGQGSFRLQRGFGTGSDDTIAAALGDLDGDGDLDIACANDYGESSAVYLNDGQGGFASSRPLGHGSSKAIALLDFDADGDLDIALGRVGNRDALYRNDGTGAFEPAGSFGESEGLTRALSASDLDGDGAIDLVAGRYGAQDFVYWNDGEGNFGAATPFGPADSQTWSITVFDADGDRRPDIGVAYGNEPSRVFRNATSTVR